MAPHEIRKETRSGLNQTIATLLSDEWLTELVLKPRAEQTRSAMMLMAAQIARVKLQNAELSQIRDDLAANEAALKEGKERLEDSLESLENTTAVLNAVGAFLAVVGQIVAIGIAL